MSSYPQGLRFFLRMSEVEIERSIVAIKVAKKATSILHTYSLTMIVLSLPGATINDARKSKKILEVYCES